MTDWSSGKHLHGVDDSLVTVKPMLDLVPDWAAYLAGTSLNDTTESTRRHNRTGRALGSAEFIHALERQRGKTLAPKRPGPNPSLPIRYTVPGTSPAPAGWREDGCGLPER